MSHSPSSHLGDEDIESGAVSLVDSLRSVNVLVNLWLWARGVVVSIKQRPLRRKCYVSG